MDWLKRLTGKKESEPSPQAESVCNSTHSRCIFAAAQVAAPAMGTHAGRDR